MYILASSARVWSALTDGNLLRQATGFSLEGRWDPGQPIELRSPRLGRAEYTGTVTNLSYPWLLQTSWRCDWAEGVGMLSFEIQERDGWAEVIVSMQHPSAHVVWIARSYWPALLCAAKTAIETGKPSPLRSVVVRPPIFDRPDGRWGDA